MTLNIKREETTRKRVEQAEYACPLIDNSCTIVHDISWYERNATSRLKSEFHEFISHALKRYTSACMRALSKIALCAKCLRSTLQLLCSNSVNRFLFTYRELYVYLRNIYPTECSISKYVRAYPNTPLFEAYSRRINKFVELDSN